MSKAAVSRAGVGGASLPPWAGPAPEVQAEDPAAARERLLIFTVDGERHALELDCVERVIRAVQVRALPGAPRAVCGIFLMAGQVVPVIDTRRQLGLRQREMQPDDAFVLVATGWRTVALWVDGNVTLSEVARGEIHAARASVAGKAEVRGVATLGSGLVLIHELERFISAADRTELNTALAADAGGAS